MKMQKLIAVGLFSISLPAFGASLTCHQETDFIQEKVTVTGAPTHPLGVAETFTDRWSAGTYSIQLITAASAWPKIEVLIYDNQQIMNSWPVVPGQTLRFVSMNADVHVSIDCEISH